MASKFFQKLSSGFRHLKEDGIIKTIIFVYQNKVDVIYIKIIYFFTRHRDLKNIIIIESHNDFDCNGGAFYNYLISHDFNKKYKIVWLLKNPTPKNLPPNVKGYQINKPSIRKCYNICFAKIFSSDNVVTPKVRSDQKSFYLTHGGITIKNVKGLIVVPDYVDYILSSSANYDPYVCDNYSIPFPNNKMIHVGYPSNDCFFTETANEIKKISHDKYNKVFLWMPTFRKSDDLNRNDSNADFPFGIPLIFDIEAYKQLNCFLTKTNSLLIIKFHPAQSISDLKISSMSNIKVLTKDTVKNLAIDINNLMKNADALISDYSSSAYQYLLLNRPIAFVLSDYNDYKLGFSVNNYEQFLPGEHIYNFKDFISFLDHVVHNEDSYMDKRNELLAFLYEYRDGNACKRLVDFMKL